MGAPGGPDAPSRTVGLRRRSSNGFEKGEEGLGRRTIWGTQSVKGIRETVDVTGSDPEGRMSMLGLIRRALKSDVALALAGAVAVTVVVILLAR